MTRYKAIKTYFKDCGSVQSLIKDCSIEPRVSGDTIIKGSFSSINYKDALAVLGKGKILRRSPLTPGIDISGTVWETDSKDYNFGDSVVATGCGLGETHDGGFSQFVTLPNDWVIPLTDSLSCRHAMILGTAGFTAALCLYRLESNGQHPGIGPIVVTGASGGVGSLAVALFAKKGYQVVALTNKPHAKTYLKSLGANEVVSTSEFLQTKGPLNKARFGGAVDQVGGDVLASLLTQVKTHGNIASVGLAMNSKLNTTVMPFILRGVSLIGITSTNCPGALRKLIWKNLNHWHHELPLENICQKEIGLDAIETSAKSILDSQTLGRIVVNLGQL